MNYARSALKGIGIVADRFRSQGVGTTLLWVYARGVPKITGVPIIRYSEVTPQLFIGPQINKAGRRKLESVGIHNSVNLRVEHDDVASGVALANHLHLPTVDDAAISLDHIGKGIDFIREAVEAGGKVYIHCAGGVGRAPTMAAAYLISTGKTVDEALQLIIEARPFIRPMAPQVEQLKEFESVLRNRAP